MAEAHLTVTSSETPEPTPTDEKYAELEAKIREYEDRMTKAEEKAKDLGSRLTKTQQENAEWLRFHKNTLPKINKSFNEQWEESPEDAIVSRVEERVTPVSEELGRHAAELAVVKVIAKNPTWAKYETRVRELGQEFPEITWKGEKGIEKLFQMARAEDLESSPRERPKAKEVDETVEVKTRTFSEDSSPRSMPSKNGTKLNPDQMFIAKKLGIKPEEYIKRMTQIEDN